MGVAGHSQRFGRAAGASAHHRVEIEVHDHDVLSGRGVMIAQHAGNERFRALVNTRYDEGYCTSYTTTEKRALAEEIVRYIKSLDPPGRFLRRAGRARNTSSKKLQGPWEELADREAVKKTIQALRDCNREDRSGYAASVVVPEDVKQNASSRCKAGLTKKQLAEKAAKELETAVMSSPTTSLGVASVSNTVDAATLQSKPSSAYLASVRDRTISPTVQNAAQWLIGKKPRSLTVNTSPVATAALVAAAAASSAKTPNFQAFSTTPTTAASTAGTLNDSSLLNDSYDQDHQQDGTGLGDEADSAEDGPSSFLPPESDSPSVSVPAFQYSAALPEEDPNHDFTTQMRRLHASPRSGGTDGDGSVDHLQIDEDSTLLEATAGHGQHHSSSPQLPYSQDSESPDHRLHDSHAGDDVFPPPSPFHNEDDDDGHPDHNISFGDVDD